MKKSINILAAMALTFTLMACSDAPDYVAQAPEVTITGDTDQKQTIIAAAQQEIQQIQIILDIDIAIFITQYQTVGIAGYLQANIAEGDNAARIEALVMKIQAFDLSVQAISQEIVDYEANGITMADFENDVYVKRAQALIKAFESVLQQFYEDNKHVL